MKISKKGFTLIELLIVIAIIGILAVAFLPTLLGAPAKGRDTSRIADLQKLQKVLVNANLEGKQYPNSSCINAGFGMAGAIDDKAYYLAALGGVLPKDPSASNVLTIDAACPAGQYSYKKAPGDFTFGLYARVELKSNANTTCAAAAGGVLTPPAAGILDGDASLCYAILIK